MKSLFFAFVVLVLISVGYYQLSEKTFFDNIEKYEVKVWVVSDKKENHILEAYKSVLEEEGVDFEIVSLDKLRTLSAQKISQQVPAIIFPDGIATYIPNDVGFWLEKYMKAGGNVALMYDAGTKDNQQKFRMKPNHLDSVLGLNMTAYNRIGDKAYGMGHIIFNKEGDADFFEIPPGKIDENGSLCGYQYGKLNYPISRVKITDENDVKIFAIDQDNTPVITLKKVLKGNLLYVNTPLGYLKGHSDDLLLRSVLRTFLFKITHVPHIVSAPNAKGTLVINWHIDSSIEHVTLPWMLKYNYFRNELIQSLHITSGPDLDNPGDGLGFDAKGKGYPLVKQIMPYGKIGSHGGWNHNWFAHNIKENNMSKDDMKHYIQTNNEALESIVGYKITEYSAPVGMFPPHDSIEIMEELGLKAYCYVGDSGSAPNRTFFDGKILSNDVIAFPVMTFGKNASMFEMNTSQWNEEKVEKVYKELVDYVVVSRSIRLYYSHPYDIHEYAYKTAAKNFLDYISNMQKEGKLQTRTMTDMAEFVLRVADTEKKFILEKDKLHIEIKNSNRLKDLAIAVPKEILGKKIRNKGFEEDNDYYYVPLKGDVNQTVMDFTFEQVSNLSSEKKD